MKLPVSSYWCQDEKTKALQVAEEAADIYKAGGLIDQLAWNPFPVRIKPTGNYCLVGLLYIGAMGCGTRKKKCHKHSLSQVSVVVKVLHEFQTKRTWHQKWRSGQWCCPGCCAGYCAKWCARCCAGFGAVVAVAACVLWLLFRQGWRSLAKVLCKLLCKVLVFNI